jgi:hypothetical protein
MTVVSTAYAFWTNRQQRRREERSRRRKVLALDLVTVTTYDVTGAPMDLFINSVDIGGDIRGYKRLSVIRFAIGNKGNVVIAPSHFAVSPVLKFNSRNIKVLGSTHNESRIGGMIELNQQQDNLSQFDIVFGPLEPGSAVRFEWVVAHDDVQELRAALQAVVFDQTEDSLQNVNFNTYKDMKEDEHMRYMKWGMTTMMMLTLVAVGLLWITMSLVASKDETVRILVFTIGLVCCVLLVLKVSDYMLSKNMHSTRYNSIGYNGFDLSNRSFGTKDLNEHVLDEEEDVMNKINKRIQVEEEVARLSDRHDKSTG